MASPPRFGASPLANTERSKDLRNFAVTLGYAGYYFWHVRVTFCLFSGTLGLLWAHFESLWGHYGALWVDFGISLYHSGVTLEDFGPILAPCGGHFGHFWLLWGCFWVYEGDFCFIFYHFQKIHIFPMKINDFVYLFSQFGVPGTPLWYHSGAPYR